MKCSLPESNRSRTVEGGASSTNRLRERLRFGKGSGVRKRVDVRPFERAFHLSVAGQHRGLSHTRAEHHRPYAGRLLRTGGLGAGRTESTSGSPRVYALAEALNLDVLDGASGDGGSTHEESMRLPGFSGSAASHDLYRPGRMGLA